MKKFTYPVKKTRKITLATLLFFYILFLLLFLPYLPYSTPTDMIVKIGVYLLSFLIVFLLVAYNVLDRILRKMAKITIDDTGVHVGFRHLNWEDLAKITHGFPFFRHYPRLLLQTKKSTVSFWTFKRTSRPIAFMGYPFVYNEIIPLIKKYRPDIEIPAIVYETQRTQNNDNLGNKILLSLIALAQIAILYIIFHMITNYMIFLVFYPIIALMYIQQPCQLIEDKFRNIPEEVSFLRAVIYAVGFLPPVVFLSFLSISPPLWTIFPLISISVLVLFIGLICVFFIPLASIKRQILLFILMIATSISCVAYFYSPSPPFKDLSTLIGEESHLLIWGDDGRYIAGCSVNDEAQERFVIDTHELKRIQIPLHNGCDSIKWMDSSMVIRHATISGDINRIYIYYFNTKEEICVANGECIKISRLHPVSPNRKQLVWLNCDKNCDNPIIKVKNLNLEDKKGIAFPKIHLSSNYKWSQVDWVDNDDIVVRGKSRSNESNKCYSIAHLALFHLNITTGISKLTVSKEQAARWFPTIDSKYALTKTGDENPIMFYINLQTNQRKKIEGENIPSWIVDNRYVFIVFKENGVKYFARFDLQNGTESKICEISDKWELSGVSRDGKYALFAPSSFLSLAYYKILELNGLKCRYIEMPGICLWMGGYADLVLSHPRYSVWSPTSNQVLTTSMRFGFVDEKSTKTTRHLINVDELFKSK